MKARININININLEIGDFRMETSLGPTLAEYMYGPESVHIFSKFMYGFWARTYIPRAWAQD